ncbi:hypothetical protein [Archangium lansingense]|uniref:Uncharacterized protein n=1 Tax=Archangium lansingense TaxID=2995310 RepID=A0ABT3ZYZ9_9BACT|nr:hypothetical protein [Archangium lansinium]MCY1074546.1 hypothetical protein [Archangium lansinium]
MSLPLRWLAASLAASGLLLSAAAEAASTSPTGPIIIDPCVLYTYTLQGCQNPANSCDQRARDAAKTDPNALCNTLIQQAGEEQAASMPTRTVKVPVLTKADGTQVQPTESTHSVAYKPDNPNTRTGSGLNSFALGLVLREQTYLQQTSAYATWLTSYRQSLRDSWNANGYVVDSCREYVHEKYYDYTTFEDRFTTLGSDYRAIYNSAYAVGRLGFPAPAYAIGTRGIADPVQRGKDGTPLNPPITFPVDQPKNRFFTVPLHTSSKVQISHGPTNSVTEMPGGIALITLANLTRPGLSLNGVVFQDTTFNSTIAAGQEYYDESWAWHKSMSERNARVLDEDMYELERLQDDFEALLRKREETVAAIASHLNPKPLPQPVPIYSGQWWRDPVWNPDPIALDNIIDSISTPTAGLTAPTTSSTLSASSTSSTSSTLQATALPTPISTIPIYAQVLDTTVVRTACLQHPIFCLLYKLEAIDNAIEAALVNARNRGCLTFNTTGAVTCDWSPKRFAQRVLSLYQKERETAFQKCMDYTDNNFALLKNRALVAGTVNYPAQDYTTSPTRLEQYFTRRDLYLKALRKVTGDLIDPVTCQARLNWGASDTYSMGDETFGASASYNVSLSLNNLSATNSTCPSPRAIGTFNATGSALGMSVQLINASANISSTRADIDLDVLDNSIHLVDVHKDLPLGTYNIVSGSKSKSLTFVDVSTTFIIVVVPVELGARLGGTVGFNYGLDVEHKVSTTSNGCNVNSVGLGGRLEPFASVDGELYAGVDLFVVSAGIKGRLQLVHAGVPLNASVGLAYGLGGYNTLALEVAGRADLKFVFMSGSIDVYVALGPCPFCVEYDESIVSWDGIRHDIPLFKKSFAVPLVDVQALIGQAACSN